MVFLCGPHPTPVAQAAVEELRQARHKRQLSMHVFVVPKLIAPYWQQPLYKVADIVLHIPAGQ
eukprot:7440782-Ditylum_brightwellii.AAC.1